MTNRRLITTRKRVRSDMSTTQRTVVITGVGAERGIGRATAHRFAADGWAVAGLDLDAAAAASSAAAN